MDPSYWELLKLIGQKRAKNVGIFSATISSGGSVLDAIDFTPVILVHMLIKKYDIYYIFGLFFQTYICSLTFLP